MTRISEPASGRALWIFVAMTVLLALGVSCVEGRKAYWDAKVAELCEKEAGIKVFHVVGLPQAENQKLLNRRHNIELPYDKFASSDSRFVYSTDTEYLVRNGLEVRKYITRVLERPGNVVLGEQIQFARIGGDLMAIDQPSQFSCPRNSEDLFAKTLCERLKCYGNKANKLNDSPTA